MTEKEKLMKIQDFVKEEFFHHASRDFFYQCCVSYNFTELFTFAKSIMELLQEEPVSEDLMDATNNYCVNVRKGYPRVMDEIDRYICNAFKAGANWQKQQMMKDAVEVYVCTNLDKTRKIPCSTEWGGRIPWNAIFENRNVGDKVKLIIIKED